MLSTKLHDVLSLFAVTIFADKRVFAKEIETFMRAAKRMNVIQNDDEHLSEAKLLYWFDVHKDSIRQVVKSSEFEPWLYSLLERLKPVKNKNVILNIMADIAKSDSDFHVSEKALIVLTANYWGLRVSAAA